MSGREYVRLPSVHLFSPGQMLVAALTGRANAELVWSRCSSCTYPPMYDAIVLSICPECRSLPVYDVTFFNVCDLSSRA